MEPEKIKELLETFSDKYGLDMALKANIAAINRMLVRRGKDEELYTELKKIIDEFEKKQDLT